MVPPEKTDQSRSIDNTRQLAEDMQRQLKRVGCYSGSVDGSWGQSSRKALERFNEATKLTLASDPLTTESITEVKNFPGVVCQAQQQPSQGTRQRETPRDSGGSSPSIVPNIRLKLPRGFGF
jgi:hypothetical protein